MKTQSINVRVSKENKATLQKASKEVGQKTSPFILSAGLKEAKKVLQAQYKLEELKKLKKLKQLKKLKKLKEAKKILKNK